MEDHLHEEARNTIGVNDAVLLHDPNDSGAFIENLRKRFKGDLIYVSDRITFKIIINWLK